MGGSEINSEKSCTTKVGDHIPCGHLIPAIWTFDNIENKHDIYRGEDCMKNVEKKKIISLTNGHQESHKKAKICCNWGKNWTLIH